MPETVIDFSENVNPLGPPSFVKEHWESYAELITTYPDPLGEPFLSAAATITVSQDESLLEMEQQKYLQVLRNDMSINVQFWFIQLFQNTKQLLPRIMWT